MLSGVNVQLAGSAIPNIDPTFFTSFSAAHQTAIETTTAITGTTAFVTSYKNWVMGVQQGYWTGTTVQLFTSDTFGLNQNATTSLFNPVDQGSLSLSITQNLLNGFGMAVNKRSLHVAKNNLRVTDLQFKQQIIATVANVVNLYWDLVTFDEDLKVKQQTLELDNTLYKDNQRRAELGSIAPIDTIQAEAEMKAAQQDVVTQETQVLQQELILKSVLTRSALVSRSMEITLADLKKLPQYTVPATLECTGNGRGFYTPKVPGIQWKRGAVGNAEWQGPRLSDVLKLYGMNDAAAHIELDGADSGVAKTPDFVRSMPVKKAMHPATLLALKMNGDSPQMHGFPVRLIVPGWDGTSWVKWVTRLTPQAQPAGGFFMNPGIASLEFHCRREPRRVRRSLR